MGEPLKTFFSPTLVRRLADDVARVHPTFDTHAFIRDACRGLDALELLDRGRHIARALTTHLPPSYPDAIAILLRSLGPEHATDELLGVGMAPFFYLPHTMIVAEHGLADFEISMHAQYEITKRFSAESCIRPYIAHDPERTFAWFERWIDDENAHVRRLVSEGTRLRLPWAPRVAWLDAHPDRVVALLDRLKDDPSSMVRRSVANNLNDLGKVHPQLLLSTAGAWLADAGPQRRALVEHALRSIVKRGDKHALKLLGFGGRPDVSIESVTFEPRRVRIGASVTMTFAVKSRSRSAQDILVDARVHFVKARGTTSPKVFKLDRVRLAPGARIEMKTRFSLAVHTTRVPHPGRHVVEVVVNGVPFEAGSFAVAPAGPTRRAVRPQRPASKG